jgi:hypothetical protein
MKLARIFLWVAVVGICGTTPALALELDENPPEPGDWGFRPEESSVPAHNPPGFTWRPVKDAAGYFLQVARDPEFRDLVYEANDLPWSAHCPPQTLEPGAYHWRYAAADAEGNRTPWSRARKFEVSSSAPHIPQPTLAQLLERMPKEHPRLFFRPEEVDELRALASGPLAKRWQALVAEADKLLESPPDLSEPPKYPEGMERGSGEWKEIWWGNRRRMIAVADGAATLAFVYRLGGGEKYAQGARDLLLGLCRWDPNGSTSFAYNDEAAMPALYMASRAYDWVYPALSEADRAAIVAMMRIRGAQTFDKLRANRHLWRPYNSHANRAWHYLGELAMAFQGEIPEADRWLDYAMTIFYTAYPVWGDADGGWHEGVSYWLSYTNRFTWWIEVVRAAFGIDVFERPFYHRTALYPMYVLPPGSEGGGFGDQAERMTSARVANLVAVLAAGARDPHWQWYAEKCGGDLGSGYLGFLFARRARDLEPQIPKDWPTSICFRDTGVAVLNSNLLDGRENVQIQFKSSPVMGTQSHGYNSNNSFLLNLYGQRAFLASGRRDVHGSVHHRDWMWETKSQNGILVNGKGQKKHTFTAKGRITAFQTGPAVDVVEGETKDEESGLERWRRRIIFLKPDVIVMHDILDAARPSTFQWLLHGPKAFEIGDGRASLSLERGRLNVRWLEPEGLAITQTDRFDVPPAEWTGWDLGEWHLQADAGEKTAHREFVTLITVDGVAPEVSLERADDRIAAIVLSTDKGETIVRSREDGFEVEAPDFRGDFGPQSVP